MALRKPGADSVWLMKPHSNAFVSRSCGQMLQVANIVEISKNLASILHLEILQRSISNWEFFFFYNSVFLLSVVSFSSEFDQHLFPSSLPIALLNVERYKKNPKPAPWESDLPVFSMGKDPLCRILLLPWMQDKPSSKDSQGIACTLRQVHFLDLFKSLQSEANAQNQCCTHASHQRHFLKGPGELTASHCQVKEESREEWRGDGRPAFPG